MRLSRIGLLVLPALWLMLLAVSPDAAQEQSVTAGVYTEEQATRGADVYNKECASCHGAGLEGDGTAPALAGSEFLTNWNGTTVGDLFDRIRISMPPGNPSSVPTDSKVDVIAHLLKSNKYPAGKTEIGKDPEPLKLIKIELPK